MSQRAPPPPCKNGGLPGPCTCKPTDASVQIGCEQLHIPCRRGPMLSLWVTAESGLPPQRHLIPDAFPNMKINCYRRNLSFFFLFKTQKLKVQWRGQGVPQKPKLLPAFGAGGSSVSLPEEGAWTPAFRGWDVCSSTLACRKDPGC